LPDHHLTPGRGRRYNPGSVAGSPAQSQDH
jgi:hypothetical protein